MSMLTSQITSKRSAAYSGLSALIQAATSQLGDLAETVTDTSETNSLVGSPPMLSNPTTPTMEGPELLEINGALSTSLSSKTTTTTTTWRRLGCAAATVTPLLTSLRDQEPRGISTFCFPETLMLLLLNPANEDVVTFLPHGKYFAIRRVDFTNQLLRKNFQLTCFEDFLEVAKRWGFIRVNGNINEDSSNCGNNSSRNDANNTNNGSGDESSTNNKRKVNSSSKTDIYVFRRSHFEKKNRPVDMKKIKLQNEGVNGQQQQGDSSAGDKAPPPNASREKSISNNKRELPPYHDNRDSTENCRQRLRTKSNAFSDGIDRLSLSDTSCDQPAQQLRRRSSKELRGVAQAITTSKIYLSKTSEVIKAEDDSNSMRYSQMIDNIDVRFSPLSGPDPILAPQLERGQSTGSSLVDGGVETATHTIVTDAIEALLFDENHTRETYNRHEKELSVSSLPGVVPISKQLFSASDNKGASSVITNTNGGEKSDATEEKPNNRAKEASKKPKLESSSSWVMYTSVGSLEDASKYNNDIGPCLSSNSISNCENLRVVIPRDDGEARQQHESIYGYMVVSPARMEAAAALVSQSRIRNSEEL